MNKSKLKEFIRSPKRSLIYISIPIIAAAIVETLYNVVDMIFVGRLGAEAIAAMTFVWPYFFFLVAVSLGLNSGISSRISRYIGEKKRKQAENTAMHGLILATILSLVITLVGLIALKPLLSMSGASGNVLEMAVTYMSIILVGVFFMFTSYAANSIFAAQGDTKTAMKIDIYSLLFNIIFTPIMMFYFHMGIFGAGLATTLSLLFALLLSIYYFRKRSYLRIHKRSFKYSPEIMKDIIKVGFPSTLMMLIISFYVIFLNRAMIHFSVEHIAAFGIVSRLENIVILPIYGLSIGAMTLAGMYIGSKKYKLLDHIAWFAVLLSVIVSCVIGAVFFIIPQIFIRIFTSDPKIIELGVPYMRLDVLTFPAMAVAMIVTRITQAMGLGLPGLMINLIRVFLVAVPLAYLFVFVLGYGYLSIAVAMVIGGIVSITISLLWLRKLMNEKNNA